MKLATSLFVIVLIAIGALLFFAGPLIDRPPNAELCNAAYALVKRQIPDNAVRRKGECLVTGSGVLHTVHWAYSTATSRERKMPPIAYEANVAFDGKIYHLCSLNSLERKQEFHHPLCDKRQRSSEGLIFDELCERIKAVEDSPIALISEFLKRGLKVAL